MRKMNVGGLVWIAIFFLFFSGLLGEGIQTLFHNDNETVYDDNMDTQAFDVDVVIEDDCSYTVTENINVTFQNNAHGIYRYIPLYGSSICEDSDGESTQIPYQAKISDVSTSAKCEEYQQNGCEVLQLGDAASYVNGNNSYTLQYTLQPSFQKKDYSNIYYNLYPTDWGNDIPAGSTFTIKFPSKVDASLLQFYYGTYGSTDDASDLIEYKIKGKKLTGTLTDTLKMGTGLTIYANVGEGYFTSVSTVGGLLPSSLLVSLAVLLVLALLYILFGRDEPIIPSIQYQPPEGLDSAAVGYIVDGEIEDRDVISLLIYWADQGNLIIREKQERISFRKIADLPSDAPGYERTLFDAMFAKNNLITLNNMKYRFADVVEAVKEGIRLDFSGDRRLYTRASQVAHTIGVILSGIPFIVFLWQLQAYVLPTRSRIAFCFICVVLFYSGIYFFSRSVDLWYGKSMRSRRLQASAGICMSLGSLALFSGNYLMRVYRGLAFAFLPDLIVMLAASVAAVFLSAFMRKRTGQCIEWMGRLIGLRDFIETAELDRIKAMAEEHPEWFYHVLPYAYVFGISDAFANKLKDLSLQAPDWYRSDQHSGGVFRFYLFYRMFMRQMGRVTTTMTTPKPQAPSRTRRRRGGFGGDFGGGGFSGGGFGGGGGGSW